MLTKSIHFLAMKTIDPLSRLAALYIWEIVHLYSTQMFIIFDRDSLFTSRF